MGPFDGEIEKANTTVFSQAKISAPTGVFRMKTAKINCKPIPQRITRQGISVRFTLRAQAMPSSKSIPRRERSRGSNGVSSPSEI